MHWLFLLLLVLNLFFYVWHQQQAPVRMEGRVAADIYRDEGRRISLLSESAPLVRRSGPPDRPQAEACLFLGGFDERERARALEQRLLSLDIRAEVQLHEVSAGLDYWVYLAPLASRQASLRQLRELQSRNIDSYIITVGDLANGISLGMFSRKDSAESVMARLRGAGYGAQIRELPRAHREYWVRVDAESLRLVDEALLTRLAREMPGLVHRKRSCKNIASRD